MILDYILLPTKSIEENDKDATILLSMGKSYSQYERERLGLCYQSKSDAEKSILAKFMSTCPPFLGASLDFNDFRLYFVANFVQFTTAFLGFFFISKSNDRGP
jgi:hypothetical protein